MTSSLSIGNLTANSLQLVVSSTGSVNVNNACQVSNSINFITTETPTVFKTIFSGTLPVLYNNSTGSFSLSTPGGVPSTIKPDIANSVGTNTSKLALADHTHNIDTAAPIDPSISSTSAKGTAITFARSDHQHKGIRSIYTNAKTSNISGTCVSNLFNISASVVNSAISIIASPPTAIERYIFAETQPVGFNGGSYPTVTTVSRILNKVIFSSSTNAYLATASSTNTDFVLKPGNYLISTRVPSMGCSSSYATIYNVTTPGNTYGIISSFNGAQSTNCGVLEAKVAQQYNLTADTTFRILFGGISPNTNSWALGYALNATDLSYETYTTVTIFKL